MDLIRYLSMERLIKNNKNLENPFGTMLEILSDYLYGKY